MSIAVGDAVAEDEVVGEIETDKVLIFTRTVGQNDLKNMSA